jgi:hypothetical protein
MASGSVIAAQWRCAVAIERARFESNPKLIRQLRQFIAPLVYRVDPLTLLLGGYVRRRHRTRRQLIPVLNTHSMRILNLPLPLAGIDRRAYLIGGLSRVVKLRYVPAAGLVFVGHEPPKGP